MKFISSLFFAVLIVVITLSGLNASRISTLQMKDAAIKGSMYGHILKIDPFTVDVSHITTSGETEKIVTIPAGKHSNDYRVGAQKPGKDSHIVAWCSSGMAPWVLDIVDLKAGKLLNTWTVNDTRLPTNMFWDQDELMVITPFELTKFDQKDGKLVTIKDFQNPPSQGSVSYNPATRTAMWLQVSWLHGGKAFFWDLKDNTVKTVKYSKNYQFLSYSGDGSGNIFGMAQEQNSTGITNWIVRIDPSLDSYTKVFEADNEHLYADWYTHVYDNDNYVLFTILSDKFQAYDIPKDSSKKGSLIFDLPYVNAQNTVFFSWIKPSSL